MKVNMKSDAEVKPTHIKYIVMQVFNEYTPQVKTIEGTTKKVFALKNSN